MAKLFTSLRLPLLAVLTSLALTSCFDRDKKCDPKPRCGTTTTTTPTGSSSGGAN